MGLHLCTQQLQQVLCRRQLLAPLAPTHLLGLSLGVLLGVGGASDQLLVVIGEVIVLAMDDVNQEVDVDMVPAQTYIIGHLVADENIREALLKNRGAMVGRYFEVDTEDR